MGQGQDLQREGVSPPPESTALSWIPLREDVFDHDQEPGHGSLAGENDDGEFGNDMQLALDDDEFSAFFAL